MTRTEPWLFRTLFAQAPEGKLLLLGLKMEGRVIAPFQLFVTAAVWSSGHCLPRQNPTRCSPRDCRGFYHP
jgi:hypothetical protein